MKTAPTGLDRFDHTEEHGVEPGLAATASLEAGGVVSVTESARVGVLE